MAVAVALFTALAVVAVWGLSLRLQSQMRAQLLTDAALRARQLAVALAGQSAAFQRLGDRLLQELRAQWLSDPAGFAQASERALAALPLGMASGVSVVDAQGTVVLVEPGAQAPQSVAASTHFRTLRSGGDRLVFGEPVQSRGDGHWTFPVGRPILRDGQFDGAVYLLVSSDYVARMLGRLSPSGEDVVAYVHPSGGILARNLDNEAAMGEHAPADRPFMLDRSSLTGSYFSESKVDGQARVYGWQRIEFSGVVLVVGLSEQGVLAPLADARRQAWQLALLLSLLLGGVGVWIVRLMWRLQDDQAVLAGSRERLREAQQIGRMGHWTCDLQHQRMYWSEQIYRLLGLDPADGPVYARYWDLVPEDEKERLKPLFASARTDRSELDIVHRIVRPDGSDCFVRLIVQRVPEEPGPVFRGILQDVTELRRAQLALQGLNKGLENRVKARTAELQALNRELESFTYSVSHDLRTPLRSIHGFATLLQESEGVRLSEEGKSFLQRIQESSRRMGLLISDLLSMAQHSRAEIHPQTVDLSAMARMIVSELERGEPQRHVRWEIEDGLQVQADPTLMQAVLQNLLGNAWKYTGRTDDARISFRAIEPEDEGSATFCVQDNGAGFDMAYVTQLFQPFKRLHAHTDFEGTGIGLATVARVVQRHGGRVRAEGALGQGACFCFSLPLQPLRPFADSNPPAR